MSFIRIVFATIVGLLIFSLLALLLGGVIVAGLSSEEEVSVKTGSVLRLNLNRPISETEKENPLEELPSPIPVQGGESTIGIRKLKATILAAKEDENIKGIYLDLAGFAAGMAHIEEIRQALQDFRTSGKFITSYAEGYSEGAYYLASIAEDVYLHPEGALDFNGLDAEVTFYKGMLDKLEVEPQIFRVGTFKSAVEPFMREDMSDANRLQVKEMLNSVYGFMLTNISESRKIAPEKLRAISDSMMVRNAQDALRLGLIDGTAYYSEVEDRMKSDIELGEEDKLELVTYDKYKKTVSTYNRSSNKIAVIVADGTIVSGKGGEGSVGSDRFAKEIRKARLDDDIKAIIIRINSPGGSFIASDVMWKEIALARGEKPIIASMGNVAASGGYYMAMNCDTIVAQPNTITGSIGIFAIMFNASGLLESKLGITTDVVKTGTYSNLYTVTRPLTAAEKDIIQTDIEEGYETFTGKAAQGRNMDIEHLKSVASGRVWTGAQAKANGLVDVLGGFDDAVRIAVTKAGLNDDDYTLRFYPEYKPFLERILGDMGKSSRAKVLREGLGEYYYYLEKVKKLNDMRGVQARMPYDIEIK